MTASTQVPDVPCWVAAFEASDASHVSVTAFQYLLSLTLRMTKLSEPGVRVPSVAVNVRRLRGVFTPAVGAATTSCADAVAVGLAEGLGEGLGLGDGDGDGLGLGEGEGLGDGDGEGEGEGEGVGEGGGLDMVSASVLSPLP